MRVHIEVDDELIARVDAVAGHRGRLDFVRRAIEQAVEQEARWQLIDSAAGALADDEHEWDDDPSSWVRAQRHGPGRRAG